MEHAFDEVFATYSGRVTASSSKKHADGVTEKVKYTKAPTGAVVDDAAFAAAAAHGVSLSQSGKGRSGAKNSKSLKDVSGVAATDAVRKLFGLETTAQQRAREEREAAEAKAKADAEKEQPVNRVKDKTKAGANGSA